MQKLRENNWNISKTAEVIDTPRSNLYKKLEQCGIKQEADGSDRLLPLLDDHPPRSIQVDAILVPSLHDAA